VSARRLPELVFDYFPQVFCFINIEQNMMISICNNIHCGPDALMLQQTT